MANEEHVALLKKGAAVWNAWRKDHPGISPDLSGADLSGADLSGADLSDADLTEADFANARLQWATLKNALAQKANFAGADLTRARLFHGNYAQAQFSGATLAGARLVLCDFWRANLEGVDLREALLNETSLNHASLKGADMSDAGILGVVFGDTDLTNAIGLKSCMHGTPSTIDFRTLAKSGPLPLAFLRGVGLPDRLIQYLPSLLTQPLQFYSCFISHSSIDTDFARRLHADLQDSGVRCWFAPEDMKIGDRIRPAIDQAVRVHDKLLLVLSENSVESDWVETEVEAAFEEERKHKKTVLFPVRVDDAVMATGRAWAANIRTRHIGDFRNWKDHDAYRKAFERLLRDLKPEILRTPGSGDVR